MIRDVAVDVDDMEGVLRRHGEQTAGHVACCHLVDDVVEGSIGQHVAVIRQEDLVVVEVSPHSPQPLTDSGVDAGVDEGDAPLADVAAEQFDVFSALGQDEVVGVGLVVVQEVVLDCTRAVTKAEDEIGVPEVGVIAHDVPEHWPMPNRHHRLRRGIVARAHAQAQAAAEEHYLHVDSPPDPIKKPRGWATVRPAAHPTREHRQVALRSPP